MIDFGSIPQRCWISLRRGHHLAVKSDGVNSDDGDSVCAIVKDRSSNLARIMNRLVIRLAITARLLHTFFWCDICFCKSSFQWNRRIGRSGHRTECECNNYRKSGQTRLPGSESHRVVTVHDGVSNEVPVIFKNCVTEDHYTLI